MSKSPKSRPNRRSGLIAGSVFLLLLILVPLFSRYAHNRGLAAMHHGDALSDPAQALVWYRVASTLAPHDQQVLVKLSRADIQADNAKAGLTAANRAIAHGGGSAGYILRSQALLELDRSNEAVEAAKTAVQKSTSDNTAALQLGLAYAVAGNDNQLGQTIGLLGPSEAATTLMAIQHNHFSLAQQLYVLGLLRSSERVLTKYQVESSQYYLLRAQIALRLSKHNQDSLKQGRGLLEKAIAISPERIDLRQALQQVDLELKDSAAAKEQGTKIQALQAGKV